MTSLEQDHSSNAAAEGVDQYLTFLLGEEEYGIHLLGVQEIKGYTGITALPNTPRYIRGVMNLRGTVIPVIDLRIRFSMREQEYTRFTVVIVVKVRGKVVGMVVDAVSDVLDIPPSQIRDAPDFGDRSDRRFITGLATINDKLVVLLDADQLMSDEDLAKPGQ